ncbi:PhoX family protein [Limnobacter parvus]|uniref:PhoX family phosphatase n=1 Tax=Limnobacter parvus TaxID=2939690 RepID=A0ABT1XD93_9BURK|nr:PhoX family phosphatase [Limnobacter parvus]MCR2745252.1 PhoX family phosphatase [Limnobacter parvus]
MLRKLEPEDIGVNTAKELSLTDIVERAIKVNRGRRNVLKSGAGLAALSIFGLPAHGSVAASAPANTEVAFAALAASSGSKVLVPHGYVAEILYRWGDPCVAGSPEFAGDLSETSAVAEQQSGDNHDAINFFPFRNADGSERSDVGLLCINHEYLNPEYYYDKLVSDPGVVFTLEDARKGQAAHGVSIIEVMRNSNGKWNVNRNSTFNRRIHGNTQIDITGPARGNALLQTAADPTGTRVLGTLNNCGAGQTPWGTYITCEENFNGYFGANGAFTPDALQARYGLNANGFGYRWHESDPRFDLNANPNEPNRHGWVVEIDPFRPASTPKKRTALGRFKHENAELVIDPTTKKVVVYMGCDERFEYVYKFVSDAAYDESNMAANADILDTGTLYVAQFNDDGNAGDGVGVGVWIPLVFGNPNLTVGDGFLNQGDLLIRTRQAASAVGATPMDRPEWVAANPLKPGEVFVTLTNNSNRTLAQVDEANPRANNIYGHIIRINEMNEDATGTTFDWNIFLLAGDGTQELFNSPDGLQFDRLGRLWVQTDGNFNNVAPFAGHGNNQMLVADLEAGTVQRFFVGPDGCEVTGVTWTPDMRTMFVDIQHPGEVGSGAGHPNSINPATGVKYTEAELIADPTAFSSWPDGASASRPRSGTVVVRRTDGGIIGT